MCGIVGIIGNFEKRDQVLKEMNGLITHRGPDDEGFFFDPAMAMAMRRLSIIDLATGKQPITSKDGNYTIVFNGEIYNYKILRKEIEEKGYMFRTHADTEVLLNLYIDGKEKALGKLRGMFAFSIFDKKENSVFIARDYFGIKPLYYIKQNEKIMAFGSEIKSLLAHPEYSKEINDEAVFNYLFFQYNPLKATFFKNIFKLLPGHYMKIDLSNGSFLEEKYWSFNFKPDPRMKLSLGEEKNKLKNLLEDSVKAHMIADVPVGSFLSGGIDSGIVATLAANIKRRSDEEFLTFTIGDATKNEYSEAREVAEKIGSRHHEIELDRKKYFDVLPEIAWHFDEPVADPSAVMLYFLAEETSKHVKVVLSGEGADELFGGYNVYAESHWRNKAHFLPLLARRNMLKAIRKIFPGLPGLHFLERSMLPVEDWYIGCGNSIFNEKEVRSIWRGEKYEQKVLEEYYKEARGLSLQEKMEFVDINMWLVGDILAKADKMTMAHSLELRVPFLDIEVADFAAKLRPDLKWRDNKTKYILREAAETIVPETTRQRRKLGFPTPLMLVLNENAPDVRKIITGNRYIMKNFDTGAINKILSIDAASFENSNLKKIFSLLMLSVWHEKFFGK